MSLSQSYIPFIGTTSGNTELASDFQGIELWSQCHYSGYWIIINVSLVNMLSAALSSSTQRITLLYSKTNVTIYNNTGALVGNLQGAHLISGNFHIIDSNTILLENFNYDGAAPGRLCNLQIYVI